MASGSDSSNVHHPAPAAGERTSKSVRWLEDKFTDLTHQFSSNKSSPESSSLNLGIYIEEDLITVGTLTSSSSKNLQKIRSFSTSLTFSNEKLLVGRTVPNCPTFNLQDLLMTENPAQRHSFTLVTTDFSLATEEILALYFEKVLLKVKNQQKSERIGNVVVSIAFTTSVAGKERLKRAFAIAGHSKLRILSPLTPTALWYCLEDDSVVMRTVKQHSKLLLVVHSLKHSFSMAVIRANLQSVAVKSYVVSQSLRECQELSFLVGHAQMFSAEGTHQESIWNAYKAGIDQVLIDISGRPIDRIIGITKPKYSKKLHQILAKFFSENALTMLKGDEILAGSCIFANRTSSSLIPPDIQLREAFPSNLTISHYKSERLTVRLRNRGFTPGNVLTTEINAPPQEITVSVVEELCKGFKNFPVSQFTLLAKPAKPDKDPAVKNVKELKSAKDPAVKNVKNPTVKVKLFVDTDEDGILEVVADFPGDLSDRIFVRVDDLAKKSSVEFGRIRKYYTGNSSSGPSSRRDDQEVVQELKNDAVLFYSVSMKTFDPRGKSPVEILAEHERLKKEAQEKFAKDCATKGVKTKGGTKELDSNLDGVFHDIRNFLSNSKAKMKDWFKSKFPGGKRQSIAKDEDTTYKLKVEQDPNVTIKSSSSC